MRTRRLTPPRPHQMGLTGRPISTSRNNAKSVPQRQEKKSGFCRLNFPDSPQPFLQDGRMAMWQRRHQHLHTLIFHYPRRLRQDAQDLAKVFMGRKALRSIPDAGLGMLKADSYTPSGESGSPWVDQADVLAPRRKNGGWEQLRFIYRKWHAIK